MRSPSASCLTVYACSRTPPAGRLATPSSSVSAHSMFFFSSVALAPSSVQPRRRIASGRVASIFDTTSHCPHASPCTSNASSKSSLTYNPSSIRAFINLEGGFRGVLLTVIFLWCCLAAGNEGSELLFQATSEEMIRAYSKVPRHVQVLRSHLHLLMAHSDPLAPSSRTRSSAPEYYFPSMLHSMV
jgi:hypothetical protein